MNRGNDYEMAVQRELSSIFEYIFLNLDELPRAENTRIELIYTHALIYMGALCWETDIAYDMRWCVRGLMAQGGIPLTQSAMGASKTVGDLTGPCLFAVFMGISRILYGKMKRKLDLDVRKQCWHAEYYA